MGVRLPLGLPPAVLLALPAADALTLLQEEALAHTVAVANRLALVHPLALLLPLALTLKLPVRLPLPVLPGEPEPEGVPVGLLEAGVLPVSVTDTLLLPLALLHSVGERLAGPVGVRLPLGLLLTVALLHSVPLAQLLAEAVAAAEVDGLPLPLLQGLGVPPPLALLHTLAERLGVLLPQEDWLTVTEEEKDTLPLGLPDTVPAGLALLLPGRVGVAGRESEGLPVAQGLEEGLPRPDTLAAGLRVTEALPLLLPQALLPLLALPVTVTD